jgi:hypothetical protein
MKGVWTWIKTNPISVASIAVVILSLSFLAWVHVQGRSLSQRMSESQSLLRQMNQLTNRTVEIPPEQPDAPADSFSITINRVAIDQLKQLHRRMNEEYEQIFSLAVGVNQSVHQPMVEGLFPEPANFEAPFLARAAYLQAFRELVDNYGEEEQRNPALPRLNAGEPVTSAEVQDAVSRVEQDFTQSAGLRGASLTPEDQRLLFREKRAKALEVLHERARAIHLYADTDPDSANFPFQILPWARTQDRPLDHQLWEGQLELWIQQDIARAIALTNNVNDPSASVIDAPVKRLIRVNVLPGYVGLHTRGGLWNDSVTISPTGLYPAPVGGQTGQADRRLADNFYVAPTGRVSNALYDVRHVRLVAHVDYARLPVFFNNLSRTNFMSVLKVEIIRDIDEYQKLQSGFLYGSDSVVEVDMIIETIWLRQWTAAMMPKLTRQYVGIDPATDLEARPGGPAMPSPRGMPGGFQYGGPYGGFGGDEDMGY